MKVLRDLSMSLSGHRLAVLLVVFAAFIVDAALAAERPNWRFSRVTGADGVPLNVVEAGERGKPAILLVHGIGQSYLSFEHQLDSDLVRNFHIVAFDLRGHGNSGKPWTRESYVDSNRWATDVAKVMEATGLDKPILLGWSYGTLVVADYLRHYGTTSLSGLVLVGAYGGLTPPPGAAAVKPDPATQESFRRMREQQASPNLEERMEAVHRLAPQLAGRPMSAEWYARAEMLAMMLPIEARRYMFDRPVDNRDQVAKIDVPMLVFVGGKDGSTPEADARDLVAKVPRASMSVYPQSGHQPFLEETERFNEDLRKFAAAVFTGRGGR